MEDSKYVVFKKSEFLEWLDKVEKFGTTVTPLDDATVIRGQDLFAAPALDVYSASIAIALKFSDMDETKRKELRITADYFHERAEESREIAFKTPD
jgi:hypothetical protein